MMVGWIILVLSLAIVALAYALISSIVHRQVLEEKIGDVEDALDNLKGQNEYERNVFALPDDDIDKRVHGLPKIG